jgi:hypothetical protein
MSQTATEEAHLPSEENRYEGVGGCLLKPLFCVVNKDGKISSAEPFGTFYYPNVFEREKAGVIVIGAGNVHKDMNIYAPKMAERITVEGIVRYADGKAAADEIVEFKATNASADIESEAHTKTDEDGKFSIQILKGLKGTLFGRMYVYAGKFENCPKLDEHRRQAGSHNSDISSNIVEVQAEENLSKIELKYPIPYCKKAR